MAIRNIGYSFYVKLLYIMFNSKKNIKIKITKITGSIFDEFKNKLLTELNIDMSNLTGSGKTHRIRTLGRLEYEFLRSELSNDSIELDITYYSMTLPVSIFKNKILQELKKIGWDGDLLDV